MKSKKTESPSKDRKKVKISNNLNKGDFHPLLDKLLELGFQLLKTRL